MEEKLAYTSLAYHIRHLRFMGLYRSDDKIPGLFKSARYGGPFIFLVIYTVQQIFKIYEVRNDVDKVIGTMFLLLSYADCIYKTGTVSLKSDQIKRTMNVLKGPIFNQGEPEHRNILLDTVRNATLTTRTFTTMALITCFLWTLHPTVLHMQGKYIEFSIWLPFDANKNPQYYVAMFYVWIQTSFVGYSNTTIDVFVAFLLDQCRTQITILGLDLKNLVEKSKKEATETASSYSMILERRLNNMIKHHKEIVQTANQVQEIFGGAVFCQLMVSAWILCCSAYIIASVNTFSIEVLSLIMYVSCILIQISLYCYYGNEVTYESEKLMEYASTVDWLEMPMKQRRSLIIFMERIKQPIRPMAGMIVPLSNSTLISIVRSSFSFYAFLKNSKH